MYHPNQKDQFQNHEGAAPVALPRNRLPMKVREKVKKLIDEISPYYSVEAIEKFKKDLKFLPEPEIIQKEKALKGHVANYEVAIVNYKDPLIQLAKTRLVTKKMLVRLLREKTKGLKLNIVLKMKLRKETEDGTIYAEPYFSSKTITITNEDEINQKLEVAEEVILEGIAKWLSEGSQWVVDEILHHFINIASYIPLRGNSCIPLPYELRNSKKRLINLKNEDNKCFLWCHVRHLNPEKVHPERVKISDKKFASKLEQNYFGVSFPVEIKDIAKIEKQNSINISILGYESKSLYPIRTSEEKYDDRMERLHIQEKSISDYVYIKDFNRLMFNFSNHKETKHFCMRCLHCFSSKNLLERHGPDCFALNGTQAIDMPAKGSKIYFKNHHRMQPVPFAIYADYEALTEKVDSCRPSDQKSYTTRYQSHLACSYGNKLVCHADQSYSKPVKIYRGGNGKKDSIEKFIEKMFEEVKSCQQVMKKHFNNPLILTAENERDFQNSTSCYICGEKYSDKNNFIIHKGKKIKIINHPVRDHCHITGKYRGSAHNNCNLQLRLDPEKLKIPVIFHNLKGYDSHFIMQKIGKMIEEKRVSKTTYHQNKWGEIEKREKKIDISVIANNFEKYVFFLSGLDRLSSNLPNDRFIYTDSESEGDLVVLKKKGVYPYDYMDSFQRFEETELPPRKEFYSVLKKIDISEDEYRHAQNVWDSFEIRNLGQYHDLYLKTDVLLLADVFENFRETCLYYY